MAAIQSFLSSDISDSLHQDKEDIIPSIKPELFIELIGNFTSCRTKLRSVPAVDVGPACRRAMFFHPAVVITLLAAT